LEAASGAVMLSPSLTASCTFCMARAITSLPVVSRTMLIACSTGTPDASSVPSVRVMRDTAVLRTSEPNIGALSLRESSVKRPTLVLENTLKSTTTAAIAMTTTRPLFMTALLAFITNCVIAGSGWPSSRSLKMSLNFGITATSRKPVMPTAATKTTTG